MLEFPQDVVTGEGEASIPPRVERSADGEPDAAALTWAAQRIVEAERPILLAGSAVISGGACGELRQLAEKLQAPVAVTRLGKGALREDHALALSNMGGFVGGEALKAADCAVAVGCRFTVRNFQTPRVKIGITKMIRKAQVRVP